MTPSVQVGTILIGEESPRMAEVLALESEPYFENWGVVKPLDGLTLDKKIHAAGSNFFFLAGEVKVIVLRCNRSTKVRKALMQTLLSAASAYFKAPPQEQPSSFLDGAVRRHQQRSRRRFRMSIRPC